LGSEDFNTPGFGAFLEQIRAALAEGTTTWEQIFLGVENLELRNYLWKLKDEKPLRSEPLENLAADLLAISRARREERKRKEKIAVERQKAGSEENLRKHE